MTVEHGGSGENGGASQARPPIEVTVSTGVFSAEISKRFALETGASLRIGRDPANHVVLDLNGVSSIHAELLFQPLKNDLVSSESPPELCICDHSRNGTSIRPGPQVTGSGWATKKIPAWERLVRGVPRVLAHGWQVLAPSRSRKGASQVPFHKRMVTVYTNAPNIPAPTKPVVAEKALPEIVAPTPPTVVEPRVQKAETKILHPEVAGEQLERKRRRERKADDPAREKKRKLKGAEDSLVDPQAAATAAAAAAAAAVAAEHRRRVEQCGAVEEELARQEFVQSGVMPPEVARTARPKRKGQPAQTEPSEVLPPTEVPGIPPPLPRMQPASIKKAAPVVTEEVRDEMDEAEAAARAVAAAAALRAAQKKPVSTANPPRVPSPEQIDSDAESTAPTRRSVARNIAPLTTANVATLGGGDGLIEFDLRSISPISAPGVAPKKKKKGTKPVPRADVSPSCDRRVKKREAKKARLSLVAAAGHSESPAPARWKPSPSRGGKARKKLSVRSDSERPRSREKRKGRR